MSMQEDELRRRRGPGAGGYEGIGGAAALPGMLLPHMQGLQAYGYSGPGAQAQGAGGGGLAAYMQALAHGGPSGRNFEGAGFQQPQGGQGQGSPVGGPNMAPGNLDNGQALGQPGLSLAVGQTGQMPPQSQSWRNYAPGYGAAAQLGYGSPGGINSGRGIPSTGVGEAPMPGRQGPNQQAENRTEFQPSSGGGGNQGGVQPGQGFQGGRNGPSGNNAQGPGPAASQQGGVAGGGSIGTQAGGQHPRANARQNAYANAQAGSASGTFGDTIHVAPNNGNNNTPSEVRPPAATVAGKKKSASGGKKVGGITKSGYQTGGGF